MPITTNLDIPPYNQTFDASKGYYEILFQPDVSVQARELNDLQAQFQNQIESFGDNIFSSGTIVSGCTFRQFNPYPYIKINDLTSSGDSASISQYQYRHIYNSTTGLTGFITDYQDGYQSTDPNLKTLYITYLDSGFYGNVTTFSAGDTLEIYNGVQNGIEQINVLNGGIGFSNSDYVVATSAIAVNVISGTFSTGSYVTNSLGANLQIVSVDAKTYANVNQVVLQLLPRSVDLANGSMNPSQWSFSNNTNIKSGTANGNIMQLIGNGFTANVVTNGTGSITQTPITNKGVGYKYLPTITIRSINNATGYTSLNLQPQNYIDNIVVASTSASVGNGYAFGISSGIIYQKGYFLRVPSQTIIVSKYNQLPDNVTVSFITSENIVTSEMDTTLNDPAAGINNESSGADRLQLSPTLTLTSTTEANANSNLLPIVKYSQGNPYFIQPQTVYSKIGDTMAQRTMEQSGNFYIDPFLVTVTSPTTDTSGNNFSIVVDPGLAYINGYRVQTVTNYTTNDSKSLQTTIQNNNFISLSYQNYITIDNVGGTFAFNTGDVISFYDTAKGFLANTSLIKTQNISPVGNLLGTARMRSMVLASGNPGASSAQYNLYLFDVQMNPGKNFGDTQSIYYNGSTNQGIADVVQALSSTTDTYQTMVQGSSALVFPASVPGMMKNANGVIYSYRTVDQTLSISNNGIITKSISSSPNELFLYNGTLSNAELSDLYVVPTTVDLLTANISGTVSCNTTSPIINGSSTSFASTLQAGDYIYVYSGTSTYDVHYITQVTNNTQIVVEANVSFANTSTTIARVFPKYVPIPLGSRRGLSANVNSNGNILTVNLGTNLTAVVSEPVTLACSIIRNGISQSTKSPNRGGYVKLCLANNVANTVGPWCLGVPDIFRLRGIWVGNSSVSNTGSNYIQSFYIDNNQNDDFYDLGYLYLQKSANVNLISNNYILVEFDYFTSSGSGYYDVASYISSNTSQVLAIDDLPLSNLVTTSSINTLEIPQYFSVENGVDVDLINCFDFRPYNANTIIPSINPALAPINPVYAQSFGFGNNDQKFPLPSSNFQYNYEAYLPRFDTLYVDQNGVISYNIGVTTPTSALLPSIPSGVMKIADLFIPSYPCIPIQSSQTLNDIINVGVVNQHYQYSRIASQLIKIITTIQQNQSTVYTDADIANIDARLSQVENYVSLNQLESNVANMSIPSSVDPSLDRFKFGYFVDNFTTSQFMDFLDPQFKSIKENGDIVPSKLNWELYISGTATLPYISVPILIQQNATIGTVSDPTFQPNCAIAVANTIAYQLLFRNITDSAGLYSPQANVIDVVNVTLADAVHMANAAISNTTLNYGGDFWSTTGSGASVELMFYAYESPTLFQIYQGNTLIVDSSSAVNLTANDITNLTSSQSNYWFNDQTSTYMKNFVNTGGGYVMYAGKILWNYTGSGGQNITIRTTNGSYAQNWKWVLSYPINGSSAGCAPPYVIEDITAGWSGCTNGNGPASAAALTAFANVADQLGVELSGTVSLSIPGVTAYNDTSITDASLIQDAATITNLIVGNDHMGYMLGLNATATGSQATIDALIQWMAAGNYGNDLGGAFGYNIGFANEGK